MLPLLTLVPCNLYHIYILPSSMIFAPLAERPGCLDSAAGFHLTSTTVLAIGSPIACTSKSDAHCMRSWDHSWVSKTLLTSEGDSVRGGGGGMRGEGRRRRVAGVGAWVARTAMKDADVEVIKLGVSNRSTSY